MILHYYNVYIIHGCINQDLKPIYVIIRIYVVYTNIHHEIVYITPE
jgi:Gpi18-like mannosyltransferase